MLLTFALKCFAWIVIHVILISKYRSHWLTKSEGGLRMTEQERLRKKRFWDALAKRNNELRGLLTTFIDDLERVAQERPNEGEDSTP